MDNSGEFSHLSARGVKKVARRLIAAGLLFPLLCGAQEATTPDEMADLMLSSIGGRAAWAEVSNTVNKSQQNRLVEPTVVTAVITMDFTRPRFRIETTAPGLHLIRVIDGQNSWRLNRQGEIEDVPPDLIQSDMQWYAGHVYRTIHRVAARDRALRLTISDQGRLEVHEGSARIAWFALDAKGEPYAFGAHDDDVGSITGPWDFVGDSIHHPSWVTRPDGAWRARVEAVEVNINLEDAIFDRPDEVSLEDVIARHVDARGGKKALDAIGNVSTRVNIIEPTFSVVGDYRASADGRMRIDIIAGDERVFSEGIDAHGVWQKRRGADAEILPASEAGKGALRRGVEFNLFGLHRFAERGHALNLVGREVIEGINYHVVRVTFADSFTTHLYVNPETWLVDRQRDMRALHPDVDPNSRMLESMKSGFETHCGVVWPTRTMQVDMATGETVQETTTLRQVCNLPDDKLRLARDTQWRP